MQLISLWILTGKNEEDINSKLFEILKNCQYLASQNYTSLKLVSNQSITYNEISNNIKNILDSYKEVTNRDYKKLIEQESNTALDAFRKRADKFWKQQADTKSTDVVNNNKSTEKLSNGIRPYNAKGIKSH